MMFLATLCIAILVNKRRSVRYRLVLNDEEVHEPLFRVNDDEGKSS